MKIISGIWEIKAEFITDFIAISKEAVKLSTAEKGNISFNFTQYKTEDNTFLFFEEWKDQKAIDFHISQTYFKDFMEKAKEMTVVKPVIKIYYVNNEKEL